MKVGIDRDTIRIGEQITLTIEVEVDTASRVIFPTGQTFLPLEVIDTPAVDTSLTDRIALLKKTYGLSAYDSGSYLIPRQQVTVDRLPYYTDSFRIRVREVPVDTTKQGLFDIKDIQKVNRSSPGFWSWFPYLLLVLLAIFVLLWYYLVRSRSSVLKRFRRNWEQLSPFERADISLNELGESRLLLENRIKEYYTRLTDITRNFLEERIGLSASELTTAQLMDLLELYRNEVSEEEVFTFSEAQRERLKKVLDRADLVKFAKSRPETSVAEGDLKEVRDLIIEIEEAFNELLAEKNVEEEQINAEVATLERRRRQLFNRVPPITGLAVILLVVVWQLGWLVPRQRMEGQTLQAKEWISSTYGFPPISVQTPEVLTRYQTRIAQEPDTLISDQSQFQYHLRGGLFTVEVKSAILRDLKKEPPLDQVLEDRFRTMETSRSSRNLITKQEEFTTQEGGVTGLKVFGSGEFQVDDMGDFVKGRYAIIAFGGPGFYQWIHLTWRLDDPMSQKVAERVMNSIEVSLEL